MDSKMVVAFKTLMKALTDAGFVEPALVVRQEIAHYKQKEYWEICMFQTSQGLNFMKESQDIDGLVEQALTHIEKVKPENLS